MSSQLAMIAEVIHLASVAVEQTQAQQRLRRSEVSLARAQSLSGTGSFSRNAVTGEMREMTWSDETCRICEVGRSVAPTAEI